MKIASHNSQHEAAEELPLISDAATITGIETMDRERREDVIDAVKLLLEVYNEEDWLENVSDADDIDWASLRNVLESDTDTESGTENHKSVLSTKLDTLQNRYEREHPMLVSIRFQAEDSFDFVPGQYVTLRYEGDARPYSIASSPNNDETEICIRRVPGGTLTPKLCETLEVGDEISIRGPNGDFVLTDPLEQHLVFIATGTGVAPLKSMINYTFEEGLADGAQRDVWLFLGASWKDDLPYRDVFRTLDAEHENFHFVPTLTREKYLSRWDGETAYVQQTMMKYFDPEAVDASALGENVRAYLDEEPATDIDARLDPNTMETYACGLNAMVFSLLDVVKATGVPEDCIDAEGYG